MGYEYLQALLLKEDTIAIIKKTLKQINNNDKYLIPYIKENLADEYSNKNQKMQAIQIYKDLIDNQKKFGRINNIHKKYSFLKYLKLKSKLPTSILKVLKTGTFYQRFSMKKYVLKIIDREKNIAKRISILKILIKKYQKRKHVTSMINFAIGKAYDEIGQSKLSKEYLYKTLKSARNNDIMSYKTRILLGDVELKNKNLNGAENITTKQLYIIVISFLKKLYKKLAWLVNFYEK